MMIFSEWRQVCRRVFSRRQTGVFLILSVGLTLAMVMFAIGRGYSFRSLPYKDGERLVMIGQQVVGPGIVSGSSVRFPQVQWNLQPLVHELMERSDLFVGVAGFSANDGWKLRTPSGNISFNGQDVTANFFDVLGVWFPELEEWKRSVGSNNLPFVALTPKVGTEDFRRNAKGQLFRTLEGGGIIVGGLLPASFVFPTNDLTENKFE
jgi:hypothetical protein